MVLLYILLVPFLVGNSLLTPEYGGSGGKFESYLDQGRVSGILYWGIKDDNNYNALIIRNWTSDSLNLNIILMGDRIPTTNCTPFELPNTEYINGYRVMYNNIMSPQYVRFIGFHTSDNDEYICSANQSVLNQNDTVDTGWIIYPKMFLSGFQGRWAWLIDSMSFQFTNVTSSPTITPSLYPTLNPTSKPTSINVEIEYGIVIIVTFQYEFSKNDTAKIIHILDNVAKNITSNIVSDDCVLSDDYNIMVSTTDNATIVNATIFVCDQVSQNELLIAFSDERALQRDLVNSINELINLQISLNNVSISSDVLHIHSLETTQSLDTTNDTNETVIVNRENTDSITMILIIVGVILLVLVILICVIIIYKIKTEKQSELEARNIAMSQMDSTKNKYSIAVLNTVLTPNEKDVIQTSGVIYNHNEQDDIEISDGGHNKTAGFDTNTEYLGNIQTDPIIVGDEETIQ
eukprot:226958_1